MRSKQAAEQIGALHDRIRLIRRIRGWSVKEMADRMGTSTTVVYQWETNAVAPSPRRIKTLAKMAGVTESELIFGTPAWHARVERWISEANPSKQVALAIDRATAAEQDRTPPTVRPVRVLRTRRPSEPRTPPTPPEKLCRTKAGCPLAPGWCWICCRHISVLENLTLKWLHRTLDGTSDET